MIKVFVSLDWIKEVEKAYMDGVIDLTAETLEYSYSEPGAAAILSFLPQFVDHITNPKHYVMLGKGIDLTDEIESDYTDTF